MKKILIVDDQSFIRTILKSHLEKLGETNIIEASNGNVAVGKAKVTKPDVILMDIIMPSKDGLEAIKELRADGYAGAIVVVTSHGDKKDEAIAAGANAFITKDDLNVFDTEIVKYLN